MSSYLDDYYAAAEAEGDLAVRPSADEEPPPIDRVTYQREWVAARSAERVAVDGRMVHPDAPHGTGNGYSAYRCRCELCTTAGVIRAQEYQDRMAAKARGHGAAGWRRGCRCVLCADSHNRAERARRARRARRGLDRYLRRRLLAGIAAGSHPVAVAESLGLTWPRVLALRQYDRRWEVRLDAALMVGRNPDIAHGTYHSYQKHRCRCPECRVAKARYR